MEKIIKLQSEQAFAETAKPGEFITSKLIDFIIPSAALRMTFPNPISI